MLTGPSLYSPVETTLDPLTKKIKQQLRKWAGDAYVYFTIIDDWTEKAL